LFVFTAVFLAHLFFWWMSLIRIALQVIHLVIRFVPWFSLK